jgi:ribosome maturation factor RimP
MISELKIAQLVNTHLEGSLFFLVDAVVKPGNKISVFIDGDQGVTIETCRELSHFLNERLDRDQEDFDLTVSSSGADRPLKLPRQYKKNTGKSLDIVTRDGEKYTGTVKSAGEEGFELELPPAKKAKKDQEIKIISLKFTDIKSAKEVITFKQ